MYRVLALFALIFILFGCSASKNRFAYEKPNKTDEFASTERDTVPVDSTKPASFEEYRQWRKANDASGQTYAEYKEWEAAYKEWIENQSKSLQ